MTRYEDWPKRLAEFIAQRQGVPFAWGTNDCLMFCADAILAQTGVDLAADERGRYSDELGASFIIENKGGTIASLLTEYLGASKFGGFAQRGDIVTVDIGGVEAAGVVDETGRRIAIFCEGRGLIRVPINQATAAWRVG